MAMHQRRKIRRAAILACLCLHHFSDASSNPRIRKVAIPDQPIGKQAFETDGQYVSEHSKWETNRSIRKMKSGKAFKSSKKSKTPKRYYRSGNDDDDDDDDDDNDEDEDEHKDEPSFDTFFHPLPRTPMLSPTNGFESVQTRAEIKSSPASKPISQPLGLAKYGLRKYDIIDDYYLRDDVFTDDVTEPPQISPPAPSIVTPPDIDSPVWSYSEDEYSPAWSYSEDEHSPMTRPAGLPSSKPDMAQCAVSVMIDRCPSLLQSIGPKEECDCYNFCGGLYLGCCAIDEPCPLTCDVAGEFVAGCRFGNANPETKVPTMSPNADTPGPPPSVATTRPTSEYLSIPIDPFTLEYEVLISRPIAQSDLVVLAGVTNAYLQGYMLGTFQSNSVLMVDFVIEYDSFLEDPDSAVVLVTFKPTALFDQDSAELPSQIDLERELELAFQGMALAGYLGRVQALPTSNAFAKTSQIFLVQNTPIVSALASNELSSLAATTTIFAIVFVISLAGFSWYRKRRKRRRIKASDTFLRNGTDFDSEIEVQTSQKNDNYMDGRGDKERLHITRLAEDERIEQISRNFGNHTSRFELSSHDDTSRSSFPRDQQYIYEDDTIEYEDGDDDEDSRHEMSCEEFVEEEDIDFYRDSTNEIRWQNQHRRFRYNGTA